MEQPVHSMESLFDQLGLESSSEAIDSFVAEHKPLPSEVKLHEAPFWSSAQASFLKQAKDEDADWAEWVDELDTLLR